MATERYIILPKRGVAGSRRAGTEALLRFPSVRSTQQPVSVQLDMFGGANAMVVDTVADNGPKLVDLEPDAAARLNASGSPVRAVKEVFYALPQPMDASAGFIDFRGSGVSQFRFEVTVADAATGRAIAGCQVVAYWDFVSRLRTEGVTDASGRVRLSSPAPMIERIVATPAPGSGYWSGYRLNIPASGVIPVVAPPLTLPYVDCVRYYFAHTNFRSEAGVTVGVIDTGCGPHADLNLIGGRNTVTGEPAKETTDVGYHGTHVAGLIGATGATFQGVRGVAPHVKLNAYRVYGGDSIRASNYALLKAMIFAAEDGCDIINLSLGGGPDDEIVREAIMDARNQGMLIVVAAGNAYRGGVENPAAYAGATPVSAMGRQGTFPFGSSEELQIVSPPYATADPSEFIAHFSNVGPQIALTAPGVGAISTLPNNKVGPLSGTSMAAPVVAGAAACLPSQSPDVWRMPRDRARSDAIERLLQTNCARRGFGLNFEGYGMPQSPSV
ncbi:MAG: S8 family serine peptidase [Methylocystis sp.]|uniref:S8 family serine peptidase n=1 Tax=Methylocystis sp. TaxID=1911079 RepID=UPI003D14C718